jgi:hypothetical protein
MRAGAARLALALVACVNKVVYKRIFPIETEQLSSRIFPSSQICSASQLTILEI